MRVFNGTNERRYCLSSGIQGAKEAVFIDESRAVNKSRPLVEKIRASVDYQFTEKFFTIKNEDEPKMWLQILLIDNGS